jgi:hypothetical protein
MIRDLRRWCLAATLVLLCAPRSHAQAILLPLDDVAYSYIDALQMRGWLTELSGIERPYQIGAVRTAVRTMLEARERPGPADWAVHIQQALNKYADGIEQGDSAVAQVGAGVYGVSQSSALRDLMRADDRNNTGPGVTGRLAFVTGPVSGSARIIADRRVRADPEFAGRQDRVLSGRMEDAYLGVTGRYAALHVGRIARSWAMPGQLGLMLSNAPYSYDHLALRLGTDKVHLSSVVARLNDEFVQYPRSDTIADRYFTTHRLGVALRSVEFGLSESIVYAGPNRGFRPALANPLAVLTLAQYSDAELVNMAFGADALWRHRSGVRVGGQLFVDDFQLDRCDGCDEPTGLAATLIADGIPLPADLRGVLSYTRVNALTYRTERRPERYAQYLVGLGHWASDFDEVRVGAQLGPRWRAPLTLYAAYRRQGTGDYRQPYPVRAQLGTWPTIFEGELQKTLRIAVSGAARIGGSIELTGDFGINSVSGRTSIGVPTGTRPEGRIRLAWEPPLLRRRVPLL